MFWYFVLASFLGCIVGAVVIVVISCMMSSGAADREERCYHIKTDK
jgi:uncharacterized membrane protein YdjX (TVP38/TMEM64 family)